MRHPGLCETLCCISVSDMGCQHPRTQVFLAVDKGDFVARGKSAVQGITSSLVQVWEGKFLQCLSSVMLWVPTGKK